MKARHVEIIWRDRHGTHHKHLPWKTHPATAEALAEWVEDYLTMVHEGYRPEGHDSPPIPHCVRIIDRGRVLAEWYPSPESLAESPVTALDHLGQGGIPEVVPSTPSSGVKPVCKSVGHTVLNPSAARYYSSLAVKNASTAGDFGVDQVSLLA